MRFSEKENVKERAEVIREIDKLDKLPEQVVKENLKKYNAGKILDIFKKPESYFKKYKAYSEILELKKCCKNYGVEVKFQASLARGLSYYNGTIFEIKTKEMKETICAGGSYLVNGNQATGVSFGLERISSLAKLMVKEERIVIISIAEDKKAINLAENLRQKGKEVVVMYGKPTKALEFANSYLIRYVIFLGSEEVKKKKVKLRDMKTGAEKLVGEKELVKALI